MPYETDFQNIDWDNLKQEVLEKINWLRVAWAASQRDSPQLHEKLVNDLYVPALKVLAEFCACVEVGDEHE